ncbi:MAG: POTRA domain-containing protein [Candidatus Omnitrophota bacterium]
MKIISLIFILNLCVFIPLIFAQQKPVTTEIFKSQEDLEEKERLDEEIWKGERFFIDEITVVGVNLINSEEINKVIEEYNNRWLSKSDLDYLRQKIAALYHEAGLKERISNIHYDIEGKNLKITVEES